MWNLAEKAVVFYCIVLILLLMKLIKNTSILVAFGILSIVMQDGF